MKRESYAVEREVAERHWWFQGRRRILEGLLAGLALPSTARLLDAGCGTGANAPVLARHGEVVGVDASRVALELREGAPVVLARLEELPFASQRFDLVTALDLLEHLEDDRAGVRELCRVLKAGGYGLFFVPAFELLWGLQDDVAEHRRRYTADSLRRRLEGGGLHVRRISYFNTALFLPILAARLAMRLYRPPVDSENLLSTPVLDRLFGTLFAAEAPLLERTDFPIGVSLLALAQRPL